VQAFISYSFSDGPIMQLMKACLEERDIDVYIAEDDPQLRTPRTSRK